MASRRATLVISIFASLPAATGASNGYLDVFHAWKEQHSKQYATVAEETFRRAIFSKEAAEVTAHNEKWRQGHSSYRKALNHLSDLTEEEVRERLTGSRSPPSDSRFPTVYKQTTDTPGAIDWRALGAVTSVKNQGNCGSCWAFSSTAAIEGINAIRTGVLADASEQEVISCCGTQRPSFKPYCAGCSYGAFEYAFSWVQANGGIASLADWPYAAATGTCDTNKTSHVSISIDGAQRVPADNEPQLRAAIAEQPVAIDIDVGGGFRSYGGGVFDDAACGTAVAHSVLLVGFNTTAAVPYYILKNSWGAGFGEAGYMRIAADKNAPKGTCGLAQEAGYPVKKVQSKATHV